MSGSSSQGPQFCEEEFNAKVNKQMVALEKSDYDSKDNKITGLVRVKNLAYEKRVVIRYSFSDWAEYSEKSAEWEESIGESGRPETDRFRFEIPLTAPNQCGSVRFAVRYDVAGLTFWDNSGGENHKVV